MLISRFSTGIVTIVTYCDNKINYHVRCRGTFDVEMVEAINLQDAL